MSHDVIWISLSFPWEATPVQKHSMADNFKGMLKKARDMARNKRNFGLGKVLNKVSD